MKTGMALAPPRRLVARVQVRSQMVIVTQLFDYLKLGLRPWNPVSNAIQTRACFDGLRFSNMGHHLQPTVITKTDRQNTFSHNGIMGNMYPSPLPTASDLGTQSSCPNGPHGIVENSFQSSVQPLTDEIFSTRSPLWLPLLSPESVLNLLRPYLLSQLCSTQTPPPDFLSTLKVGDEAHHHFIKSQTSYLAEDKFNHIVDKQSSNETFHEQLLVNGLEQLRNSLEERGLLLSCSPGHNALSDFFSNHNIGNRTSVTNDNSSACSMDSIKNLLIAGQVCDWPGCGATLGSDTSFLDHLNSIHQLSLQSLAQVEVCASRLELYLRTVRKESQRLNAMLKHLFNQTQLHVGRVTTGGSFAHGLCTAPSDTNHKGVKLQVEERNGHTNTFVLDSAGSQLGNISIDQERKHTAKGKFTVFMMTDRWKLRLAFLKHCFIR
ncbi:hypothetical protein PHET_06508 [Paragonimus heterotremus]|uniref:FOXP coiled-coil domain-containing protein n=1 Tax=Paragonimus heterotremus TaxID=100268 RepID=A0A8J4WG98_9TREM|nr:hypothetical protein PHET_06508 [Paragonimus heterotremus]